MPSASGCRPSAACCCTSAISAASGLYGAGNAPDVGWFAYAPLTAKAFSPGHSTDYWTLAFCLSGVRQHRNRVNIVTTILCMRCPGMTLGRMPLLVWLYLVMAVMVLVAISPLTAAQIMLLLDRYLGAHFFDTQAGGSAVLWMHFFWIFGHPEVYILVIPAFAFASEIIPVFSRKAIFGYPVMVAAIGGNRLHQPERVGAPHVHGRHEPGCQHLLRAFDDGDRRSHRNQDLQLAGDDVGRKDSLPDCRCCFALAFLFQFLIAGLTGIMLCAAPFDWQLGNSYFVVAHFHYVLVGGILFTLFAAFYYWFPKMTGQDAQRDAGQVALLALRDWLPSDLRLHACSRTARHAAPNLHLRARPWLGRLESDRDRSGRSFRRLGDSDLRLVTCCGLASRAKPPATIPGMRGRWNGPPLRRRRTTTSRRFQRWGAAGRCGT